VAPQFLHKSRWEGHAIGKPPMRQQGIGDEQGSLDEHGIWDGIG